MLHLHLCQNCGSLWVYRIIWYETVQFEDFNVVAHAFHGLWEIQEFPDKAPLTYYPVTYEADGATIWEQVSSIPTK